MSLRIVAGKWGGRRLRTPRGRDVRPTSDRVREALFSILGPLDGARVLDLFAGSGALGPEALSPAATSATPVARAPPPVPVLRDNVADLGAEAEAVAADARAHPRLPRG